MSAICGIMNLDGSPLDPRSLRDMVASAISPAPDGVRYWDGGHLGFAFLGLHITPESTHEIQPYSSSDIALVADLRLDSRDDLIASLIREDQLQKPRPTDCDILVAAYRRWGPDCVTHLLGDFAFAIWDVPKRRVFIARDSLGARGISYSCDQNRFVFASDLTSILSLPFCSPELDEDKITDALMDIETDPGHTYFKNIRHCKPGHYILVDSFGVRENKYWEPGFDKRIEYSSDDEYAEHFLELVGAATHDRMRSIGPVGVSLSGGCDSTLVAAVGAKQSCAISGPGLKTFSNVFDTLKSCDERRFIQSAIDHCGLDATFIPSDTLWTFHDLAGQALPRDGLCWDCYALLPTAIARAASDSGCRVLLDGHFGDALFTSGRFVLADLVAEGRFRAFASIIRNHGRHIDTWDIANNLLRPLLPASLKRIYRRVRPATVAAANPALHADRLRGRRPGIRTPSLFGQRVSPGRIQRYRDLTASWWTERHSTLESMLRLPMRRCSPYFDRRIVEFIMALPTEQLGRPGRNRWIQRNAMRKVLPAAVAERSSKTSFEELLRIGLLDKERTRVQHLSHNSLITRQNWVKSGWLDSQIEVGDGWDSDGYFLSKFLHFELWLRAIDESSRSNCWSTAFRYREINSVENSTAAQTSSATVSTA
ncbi:MAG: asparagine synthase-related protein [Gammaproteobacteria bacterium]|nr:asparagine synthase-related protein [Gammaproteobacteria bacterium]MDH3467357.1 asparagine synthase-related protein [Gammaproteobacteria bacterium]